MKTPLEQCGWRKVKFTLPNEYYFSFEDKENENNSIEILNSRSPLIKIDCGMTLTYEELQALYKTAKQIKEGK